MIRQGVVIFTRGNASNRLDDVKNMVIKPFDIDYVLRVPSIVVKNQEPFSRDKDVTNSVLNAVTMENGTEMDLKTLVLKAKADIQQYVWDKHYK